MKVKATLLPTGGYHLELVKDLERSELTVHFSKPRVPQRYSKWDSVVSQNVKIYMDLASMESVINTGQPDRILSAIGFSNWEPGKQNDHVTHYWSGRITAPLHLQNVRKKETKEARTNLALAELEVKTRVNSEYLEGWLTQTVIDINKKLCDRIAYENRQSTDRFKNFLFERSEWAISTDERAGVKEALAQVEVWHDEIERLEEKIRSHEELIREARAKAFVEEWISEGWMWTNTSDNDADVPLPEEHQKLVLEMAENKELFKGVFPRRMRLG